MQKQFRNFLKSFMKKAVQEESDVIKELKSPLYHKPDESRYTTLNYQFSDLHDVVWFIAPESKADDCLVRAINHSLGQQCFQSCAEYVDTITYHADRNDASSFRSKLYNNYSNNQGLPLVENCALTFAR